MRKKAAQYYRRGMKFRSDRFNGDYLLVQLDIDKFMLINLTSANRLSDNPLVVNANHDAIPVTAFEKRFGKEWELIGA